jgi:hypothetical protein
MEIVRRGERVKNPSFEALKQLKKQCKRRSREEED